MTDSTSYIMLERKPRYAIQNEQNVNVFLQQVSESDSTSLTASLIDLSESGAKLSATSCVPVGESVQLKLSAEQFDDVFLGEAQVCWSRPDKDGDCLVACAFHPHLPVYLLDMLVDYGLLQRRDSERKPASLPVMICWGLGEEASPARLRDYSDCGFCIVTSHPVETGQHLLMEYLALDGEPLSVRAKVQWAYRNKLHNQIGCTILSGEDFGCLRDLES